MPRSEASASVSVAKLWCRAACGDAVLPGQRLPGQAPDALGVADAGVAPVPAVAKDGDVGHEVKRGAFVQRVFGGARELKAGGEAQLQAVVSAFGLELRQLDAIGPDGSASQGEHQGEKGKEDGAATQGGRFKKWA